MTRQKKKIEKREEVRKCRVEMYPTSSIFERTSTEHKWEVESFREMAVSGDKSRHLPKPDIIGVRPPIKVSVANDDPSERSVLQGERHELGLVASFPVRLLDAPFWIRRIQLNSQRARKSEPL
jgi:hypothetical protein